MQTAIRRETLSELVFPSVQGIGRGFLALGFSGIIALSARLAIPLPFTPVPITGQTFAVVLTGALLGPHYGVLAVLFYLIEGGLGLPVFGGGMSGWAHMAGSTAGYLFGFVLAAFVVGSLAQRGWDRKLSRSLAMMLIGEAVILVLGATWLTAFVGTDRVLMAGVVPFLPGALVKAALAAALLPLGWRALAAWR
ncbi:MAG: biotin transporter BioY [Acidobacteria bacterium]|nr:biotin transporter BioY [Acidobacteriota bacterium]